MVKFGDDRFFDLDINGVKLSSVEDLSRRATAFCITSWDQGGPFSNFVKMEAISFLASIGRFNQLCGIRWSRPHACSDQ